MYTFLIIGYLTATLAYIALVYSDIKYQKVNINLAFLYIIGSIIINNTICVFPILIFITIGFFSQFILKKKGIGEADYLIVLGSSFLIANNWYIFIMLSGLFGIITSLLCSQKTQFPFIPSIILATIATKILSVWS